MGKKLCFLIWKYNNGNGEERVTSQVANALANRGYDISIISIEKGLDPHFNTDDRISLYELNQNDACPFCNNSIIERIKIWIWAVNKIRRIKEAFATVISDIMPDIVVAVDVACYQFIHPFRNKYGYKTIGWEHFSLHARSGISLNYSQYLATKYAEKLVVLSNNDLLDYKAKYPKATNLMCIHNPIAFDITNNVDVRNKVVIAAGRYVPQKGFDLLLEAWKKISIDISDWELRIYGDGEERQKLENYVVENNLNNVKLLPYENDLDKEMEKASIFALSSRYEGWALVLGEAQSKGLPCISFACNHGPSEIIDDGVNGFLVTPEDVGMFADKLSELMQDENLRLKFSQNSHKDLQRLCISNIVCQWTDMLESI